MNWWAYALGDASMIVGSFILGVVVCRWAILRQGSRNV